MTMNLCDHLLSFKFCVFCSFGADFLLTKVLANGVDSKGLGP